MSEVINNSYAVILAGGGGTRLWPKSRRKHPKHLLKLFGDKTLLELTYERVEPIIPPERIFVITSINHVGDVQKQLKNLPEENIIAEPIAKNTALAMGTAAAYIHRKNPKASVIYLAADHIYKNIKKFQETALSALEVSKQGDYIVAIGIRPTFPHTGLGYIRIGDHVGQIKVDGEDLFVFKGKGFKEKPDLVTAQSFLASGQYLWNANLYCWSTETIIKSFEELSPKIYKAVKEIIDAKDANQSLLDKIYNNIGDVDSIDYEVSEKAKNIVVVPGDFGWSDIGDWKMVYDTETKDEQKNVIIDKKADYINIGSEGLLVESYNSKMIVTIGLKDIVIIDTEDALLICSKEKSQDVKKAVEKLKLEKKDKYL